MKVQVTFPMDAYKVLEKGVSQRARGFGAQKRAYPRRQERAFSLVAAPDSAALITIMADR